MIAIPNMSKPKSCDECRILRAEFDGSYNKPITGCRQKMGEKSTLREEWDALIPNCPIIEIDENDPMLLEFLNEFDKWRAYMELMDSIRMAQKKGEADDGNLNSYNITETEYTIAKDSETVVFKNGKNQF